MATTSSTMPPSIRKSARYRNTKILLPHSRAMTWARSSTSSPTTWASWAPTMPGGWTCWRTDRPRPGAHSSTSTGSRSIPTSAARCCCRCWATTTARCSTAANCAWTTTRCAASSACSITSTGCRSIRRPIRASSATAANVWQPLSGKATSATANCRPCSPPSATCRRAPTRPRNAWPSASATRRCTNATSPP